MRKLGIVISVLIFSANVLVVFGGCSPREAPAPSPAVVAPAVVALTTKAPVKEAWEEEWERLVLAAQREGRLVRIGSTGGELRVALDQAFEKKYGIRTESIAGSGTAIAAKILAERRAGLYLADILLGGPTTQVTLLKPEGVYDPLEPVLILPEVTNPAVWWEGRIPFLDPGHILVSAGAYPSGQAGINTELVKPAEIKSYRDLLDPKWKGKILINDVTSTGAGGSWFQATASTIMGMDYVRELAKQEPVILRDQRQQVDWLAKGKYPILIAPKNEIFVEYEKAGAPIQSLYMAEGAYMAAGSSTVGLINRAPHPNAAKLFINWLLTKEGLTAYSKGDGSQTARLDVPTDFLDPLMVRQAGQKYYNPVSEEYFLKRPEHLKVAKEIFGQFVK